MINFDFKIDFLTFVFGKFANISTTDLFLYFNLDYINANFYVFTLISRSENSHKSQANEERKVKLERERMKYKAVKVNLENSEKNTMKAEEIAR